MRPLLKQIKHKLVLVSCAILAITVFFALFAPQVAPNAPEEVALERKLQPSDRNFPLGTDHLGRCIFSRVVFGARVSLSAGFSAMAMILIISLGIGSMSGYLGGRSDTVLMRVCDVFLAFPSLILAMAICGILGPGLFNVVLSIVLSHWAWYARIIRGMVMSLKEREFVHAARVAGTGHAGIIIHHMLPSILAQIMVLITLDFGHIILHVAGLSFLGLGVQPPTPEWGTMINDARPFVRAHPALMVWPGMMIFLANMSFNILGDRLRDMLDPSAGGRKKS